MKLPVLTLLCAISLSACAQSTTPAADKANAGAAPAGKSNAASAPAAAEPAAGTPEARASAAIRKIVPTAQIDHIGAAPLAGFREVIVDGQTLYISDDGRYIIQGTVYDAVGRKDLSQIGMSALRREELKKVPVSDRIVFAPPNPKHTVAVFTDIECGFCRKLHQEISEYNRLGIAIQYLAFPRAGLASEDFRKMEAVWCSADRRSALTNAKNGLPVETRTCTNPVQIQWRLGRRLGLQGTPMIVSASGVALPGYLPPAEMLKALDQIEKDNAETAKVASAAGAH